jgi:hypothetical protein
VRLKSKEGAEFELESKGMSSKNLKNILQITPTEIANDPDSRTDKLNF